MANESLEIALIKYNKKTWCKSAVLGFFIGLAVIVPGISGSTVAIIFRLYDQFLYALGNLFKKFKQCFTFLLPIGIGIVLGVLLGFLTVKQLLEWLPFAIICLFAGLMSGAFPAVKDELKGAKWTAKRIALFVLGLCIPLALGCFSALAGEGTSEDAFANIEVWHVAAGVVVGAVMGITQIVPGLSASAFLMAIGWFKSLTNSVSLTYWQNNPAVILLYAGLAIGFVGGILGFSKLLTHLFSVARHTSYSMIVGLSLGSILSIFFNSDTMAIYRSWSVGGVQIVDIVLGIVLFAAGLVAAYLLVRFQRKKDAEEAENAENGAQN
ncbi:MAG: DUF368 domain-containing protein [Clostridia bacterium]|nr:DUF368 domain-containing protein [Clostridia bacterium]